MSQVWASLQAPRQQQQQQQQTLVGNQNDLNRQNTSSPSGMMNQQQLNQMYPQPPSHIIQQQSMPPAVYVQHNQMPTSIVKQEPIIFNQQPQQSKQMMLNKQPQQQMITNNNQEGNIGGVHIKQEYMNNPNMATMNGQSLSSMQQGQHIRQHMQPQNIQQPLLVSQTSQQQYSQQVQLNTLLIRQFMCQLPPIRHQMSTVMPPQQQQQQSNVHQQQKQMIQQQQQQSALAQNSQLQQQTINYQNQPSQQQSSLSSIAPLTSQQPVQATVQQPNRVNIHSSNQQQQSPSNSSIQQHSQSNLQQSQTSPMQTNTTLTASTVTQTQQPADEILQQILTSPNPTKQTQNAQTRLRNIGRRAATAAAANSNTGSPIPNGPSPSGQMPLTPGSDPTMMMMQSGSPQMMMSGSPMSRYMTGMTASPQFRPNMSPMNMINYGSPMIMADEEIQYYYRYFAERIRQLVMIISKLNQEGQYEKVVKLKQFHFDMSHFMKNPVVDNLMMARRLKEHFDRYMDPRVFGDMLLPRISSTTGIFEQCYKAITDYLNKDTQHKASIAKRFLEPLSDIVTGVPHKIIRLDSPKTITCETVRLEPETIEKIIENEFSQMPLGIYKYDLKSLSRASCDHGYLLTCRLIEENMPILPALKIKISAKYPDECPEILSLTKTIPITLENYDGHEFFESIAKTFIYFLFKLPAQHTVTDILDIWRTSIRSALKECYFPTSDDDSDFFEKSLLSAIY
ncbi:unnamed protein product [Didymodactylos carnosus]|uniref:ARC105/Med15 mediator subunit C-terminal domain-containing protein n=1 Tax=Didymodactylos carnosus TaxID=1234261 RepID=A0A813RM05_9BILA|nr:unnamed protein product [Didymodactylos carnosus]CAF0786640.1 unnamed protein product [Didymodactylos carnosus]CAF3503741.1 unnamed protein product [Didymodactylos carnosus]CAF3570494.1 unnamed protein product [Didymodactylos carnosus]